jgi:hypothetical protein
VASGGDGDRAARIDRVGWSTGRGTGSASDGSEVASGCSGRQLAARNDVAGSAADHSAEREGGVAGAAANRRRCEGAACGAGDGRHAIGGCGGECVPGGADAGSRGCGDGRSTVVDAQPNAVVSHGWAAPVAMGGERLGCGERAVVDGSRRVQAGLVAVHAWLAVVSAQPGLIAVRATRPDSGERKPAR